MNKLFLIGNLTKDPETRTTPNGKTVCNFDIAVNDGQGNATYFHVSAWEKQGENCQPDKYNQKNNQDGQNSTATNPFFLIQILYFVFFTVGYDCTHICCAFCNAHNFWRGNDDYRTDDFNDWFTYI